MSRARRVVIVVLVCLCSSRVAVAQGTAQEGWVVLPVDEYRALRARGVPDAPPATSPPVDATLTRIDYELKVDPAGSLGTGGEAISGRVLLTIDVLRDGWIKAPIPAGLMVRDARIDGQPVALVDGPPAYVLLSHQGRSIVALDVSFPLASTSGSESIALPSSAAPSSRATLTLPRGNVDVTVNGGFISEHNESASESRWIALGRSNQALSFTWKRKIDDRRAEQPLRFRARVASFVGLGEEVTTTSTVVRIDVQQGVAREVTLAIPAGLTINQVNGATVADWDVSGTMLRVRFLDPVATEGSFVIQGEARLAADGDIAVPLIRAAAAERETGGVAINVVGAGEIEKQQMRGLEPGDVSDLADVVAGRESPSTVAFRLRPGSGSDARTLAVQVKRYTPQAVLIANIEEARYRALAAEDGLLLIEARYAVRNNQRSFLKVTLPPGATIWSASVGGRPVRPGVAEEQSVLIALEKGRAGEDAPTFVVKLTYLQPLKIWSDRADVHLDLPALDLPVSRTGVELHHSPRYRIDVQPGPFRVEPDPGVFADALRLEATGRGHGTGLGAGTGGATGGRALPPPVPAPPPAVSAAAPPPMAASASPVLPSPPAGDQLKQLIERYRNDGGGRTVAGTLPVDITFPTIGPSLFLAAELTPESQAPSIDLAVRKINKTR